MNVCTDPTAKLLRTRPEFELGGSRSSNHGRNGHRQNLQIEPQRPFIQIFQIEFHPLLESDRTATLHLPQAGNPGSHTESPPMPVLREPVDVPYRQWPRANQAHVTLQHIE